MEQTSPIYDSHLQGAFGPTVLLGLRSDRVLAATPEACELFGEPQLAGRFFAPRVRDTLADFLVFIDEVQHRGSAWTRKITLCSTKNDTIECELSGRLTEVGNEPALLLNIIDLATLARHAEEAAAAQMYGGGLLEWQRAQSFFSELERQNQLILDAAGEGIYGVNADGKTTFVNRAAQEMLGLTSDDLLGHDIHQKIHHHLLKKRRKIKKLM